MEEITTNKFKDDNILERQFIFDYATFGAKINLNAIVTLLEKARNSENFSIKKGLCLSGMQLLFSSYEDFSLLLHSFQRKKNENKHIHLSLGVEKHSRQGSTLVPKVFKKYGSYRQILDELGFVSVTYESLKNYLNISEQELEEHFRDFANSIKQIGKYQDDYNDLKNRLKHGKAIFECDDKCEKQDQIIYLIWDEVKKNLELKRNVFEASIDQLEIATTQVAKIYLRQLELLWLFILQYYNDYADKFLKIMNKEFHHWVRQVDGLGINLNEIAQNYSE